VDRTGASDPLGSLGVGRFLEPQTVTNGSSVTLSCQTTGRDDPMTEWFFVDSSSGCGTLVNITDGV